MRSRRLIGGGLIAALVALVAVGLWHTETARDGEGGRIAVVREPQGVMGTTCALVAVVQPQDRARAEAALDEAEEVLRTVEARMSAWLEDSEVGHLNAAAANEKVALSRDTVAVLRAARDAAVATEGAFDVTCRPLIELWRNAGAGGGLPTQEEVDAARARSTWDLIELTDDGATKRQSSARVDLGGLAKGYAIGRAAEALERAGLSGGMVDVGGDLLCFGYQADGRPWTVEVKNPFAAGRLGRLAITGRAVCTSGNYARFTLLQGRRYSHIIDPRLGRPADAVPSVTVVAPSALTADIWATALSVLGPDGLDRIPEGVEALMIVGSPDDYRMLCTPGLRSLLAEPRPEGLTVWESVG